MATWRFYQGLRAEWRWYRLDEGGNVIAESDQGFAELRGCMANAESAGFTGHAYQVHARQAGALEGTALRTPEELDEIAATHVGHPAADEQPAR